MKIIIILSIEKIKECVQYLIKYKYKWTAIFIKVGFDLSLILFKQKYILIIIHKTKNYVENRF
jgi:hypothetical protein